LAPTSILIIDDEAKMGEVLARMLARDGYEVDWTDNPEKAMAKFAERGYDIVLCDLRMPQMSGIDVLERGKRANPQMDFVMMTAYATPQTAVESMKKGAIDYLIKPFAIEELKALVKRIEQSRAGRGEEQELPRRAAAAQPTTPADSKTAPTPGLIAGSQQMQEVLARARKVAMSNASVLLRGESGTGKEVLARFIHANSPRSAGPFLTVNCGAIPENLMESELFGHLKGAFTGATENRKGLFESASGGTVVLDEIGELPLHLQVKLLRVLQEGEVQRVGESTVTKVDVRVIAATNRNLEEAVARGEFRQDLYYRLNVIPIHLPPLRERRTDLDPLVDHFLKRFSPGGGKKINPEARGLLARYDFPGNIRELENAIEHAVVLSDGDTVQVTDLPFQIQNFDWAGAAGMAPANTATTGEHLHLDEIEKRVILNALEKTRYNFTRAAAHLGITRRTLGYRIQKYGLDEQVEEAIRRRRETKA